MLHFVVLRQVSTSLTPLLLSSLTAACLFECLRVCPGLLQMPEQQLLQLDEQCRANCCMPACRCLLQMPEQQLLQLDKLCHVLLLHM
jgi:hypothetical protein